VDGFIDRLADLLKTLLGSGEKDGNAGSQSGRGGGGPADARGVPPGSGQRYVDPDLRDAWEELDDYMRGGTGRRESREQKGQARKPRPPADESLRQDYANLEVAFGADIETVKKSYKTLMMRYHPDKHAGNPEKQRVALEITKKINESFERIRSREGTP
jgi:hypothetical protein